MGQLSNFTTRWPHQTVIKEREIKVNNFYQKAVKWIIEEPLLLTEYIEQNKVDYREAFAIIRINRTE